MGAIFGGLRGFGSTSGGLKGLWDWTETQGQHLGDGGSPWGPQPQTNPPPPHYSRFILFHSCCPFLGLGPGLSV